MSCSREVKVFRFIKAQVNRSTLQHNQLNRQQFGTFHQTQYISNSNHGNLFQSNCHWWWSVRREGVQEVGERANEVIHLTCDRSRELKKAANEYSHPLPQSYPGQQQYQRHDMSGASQYCDPNVSTKREAISDQQSAVQQGRLEFVAPSRSYSGVTRDWRQQQGEHQYMPSEKKTYLS